MDLKELPKCPVETTLRLIGEKWRILIIRDLLRVEYTLTDVGYSLAPVLDAMASWGTDYKTFLKLLKKMG